MSIFQEDIYEIDSEPIQFSNDSLSFDILVNLDDQENQETNYREDLSICSKNDLQQYLSENLQIRHSKTFKPYFDQRDSPDIQIENHSGSQTQIYGCVNPPELETKLTENYSIKKKKALNLNNQRRKLAERQKLRKLFKKGHSLKEENKKNRTGDQWTKNLLKVAKCSICNFLRYSEQGNAILQNNLWLKNLIRKETFYLEDFDLLYKKEGLEQILTYYFSKRILYRDLMISRVTEENKQRYMYYLDVFEENFKCREFKGISQPKQRIDKKKRQKQ